MRNILRPKAIPGPKFNYSPCVKVGPIYQFAGLVGLNPETGSLVSGGPGAETTQILTNIINALPEICLALNDLYSARVFTTQFDRFDDINAAWNKVFANIDPPARTAVGVSALPIGATVEIELAFYKE